MRQATAILTVLLLGLAGCFSPPIPQELVDVGPPPASEPMRTPDILRLSNAGLSDEVVIELIRTRGMADHLTLSDAVQLGNLGVSTAVQLALVTAPPALQARAPGPRIVYRELFIPLWPSYAGGRWHVGLHIGCYYRAGPEEPVKVAPEAPRPPAPQPDFIDP